MGRALLLTFFLITAGFAQDSSPDSSRFEIAGSYWSVHTSRTIRASGTTVDLQSDLGVNENAPQFTGRLDIRLTHRQWLRFEGTPINLTGANTLATSIVYQGHTYSINEHITSSASLDYAFAGYQFDLLSRPSGHLGLEAGGAYLGASGTITSHTTGITESKSETIGLPLAGVAFRIFPIHGRVDVEINGEAKGMDFGSYGSYFQVDGNVGVGHRFLFVQGGYRLVSANIRSSNNIDAVSPQFRGPVISLVFRM